MSIKITHPSLNLVTNHSNNNIEILFSSKSISEIQSHLSSLKSQSQSKSNQLSALLDQNLKNLILSSDLLTELSEDVKKLEKFNFEREFVFDEVIVFDKDLFTKSAVIKLWVDLNGLLQNGVNCYVYLCLREVEKNVNLNWFKKVEKEFVVKLIKKKENAKEVVRDLVVLGSDGLVEIYLEKRIEILKNLNDLFDIVENVYETLKEFCFIFREKIIFDEILQKFVLKDLFLSEKVYFRYLPFKEFSVDFDKDKIDFGGEEEIKENFNNFLGFVEEKLKSLTVDFDGDFLKVLKLYEFITEKKNSGNFSDYVDLWEKIFKNYFVEFSKKFIIEKISALKSEFFDLVKNKEEIVTDKVEDLIVNQFLKQSTNVFDKIDKNLGLSEFVTEKFNEMFVSLFSKFSKLIESQEEIKEATFYGKKVKKLFESVSFTTTEQSKSEEIYVKSYDKWATNKVETVKSQINNYLQDESYWNIVLFTVTNKTSSSTWDPHEIILSDGNKDYLLVPSHPSILILNAIYMFSLSVGEEELTLKVVEICVYKLLTSILSEFEDLTEFENEKLIYQIYFDFCFIWRCLRGCLNSSMNVIESFNSVKNKIKQKIDPIEFSLIEECITTRIERAFQRHVNLLGCLVSETSSVTKGSFLSEQHNIVGIVSGCSRFSMLPVSYVPKREVKEEEKVQLKQVVKDVKEVKERGSDVGFGGFKNLGYFGNYF